ncbi:MAG: hypothetical protein K9L82_15535 [Chromatiaceae bacterium]|nr:hypothetical protein [Chromatiaceae bacterium]MCF7996536.1 hypothetical protein [Chromatiaceae bacterium]MCF8017324.1 hypothetical protein [Chromatiaceae bacterium]
MPPSPSTDPADMVLRLRVATDTGRLPPDVAAWLGSGLDAFLSDTQPTLCKALGLRAAGRTGRVQHALKLQERDTALRLAADTLPSTEELLRLVRRFETDTWPRVRSLDSPPERFNATQRALFRAFKASAPPRSRSGLMAALRRH